MKAVQKRKNSYSANELEEFREIIKNKLEKANKDYGLLKGNISHADDH